MDALGRPAKDIDFVVPQGHRKGMRRFLEARGYVIDRDLLIAMEGRRYSFSHPGTGVDIDVFVERMEFCHTVEVAGRMDKHPMTICPDDLLLQKLQVIRMTTTDLLDAGVLLATHRVAGAGPAGGLDGPDDCAAEIDAPRIAGLMARDWGFHHTATANLARVQGAAAVEPRFGADAAARIDERAACCWPRSTPSRKPAAGGCGTGSASASSGGRTWTRRRPRTDAAVWPQKRRTVAQRARADRVLRL